MSRRRSLSFRASRTPRLKVALRIPPPENARPVRSFRALRISRSGCAALGSGGCAARALSLASTIAAPLAAGRGSAFTKSRVPLRGDFSQLLAKHGVPGIGLVRLVADLELE